MRTLLSAFILLFVTGCGSSGGNTDAARDPEKTSLLTGKLVITGSSSVAPIISEAGKRFENANPGVRIDIQTGGSSRGIADVRTAAADIGMISRALKPDEPDLKAFTVALDGVCVILHSDNPLKELTDAQVVAIYTGKTTNWKDVGGKDASITVVNKAEGRSTLELFTHYYKFRNSDIKAHVVIGDNEQAVKTVVGNPNSIGYVSIGTAEYNVRSGTPICLLAVGGVAATSETVKNRSFPFSRPLNLITNSEPKGLAKAFIDFCCSKEINDIIKEQFFVPVHE